MTIPVPQDYFEVVVKGADGAPEGNSTSVEVRAKVLLDGTNVPFCKAHDLYKSSVHFALWNARVPLSEAYLKLHVFDNAGVHLQVFILNDTGATPPPVEP